jgi:hypothetical protein
MALPADSGEWHDIEGSCLKVRINKKKRSWFAVVWKNHVPYPLLIGPVEHFSVKEARALAKAHEGDVIRGTFVPKRRKKEGPAAPTGDTVTLRQGIEFLRAFHENSTRPKTKVVYARWLKAFDPWLDRPMNEIRRAEVQDLHRRLRKERGRVTADRVVEALTTVWRRTLVELEDGPLKAAPTQGIVNRKEAKQKRKRYDTSPGAFRANAAVIAAYSDPVQRLMHQVARFMPLRLNDIVTLRWCDVCTTHLHLREPKGGEHRAYDYPMTRQVAALLEEVRPLAVERQGYTNDPTALVFPAPKGGQRTDFKQSTQEGWRSHCYRHHWRQCAGRARQDGDVAELLMNHTEDSVLGVVQATYYAPDWGHKVEVAQAVADYIERLLTSAD